MLRALPLLLLAAFAPAPDEPGLGDTIMMHAQDYNAGPAIELLLGQTGKPEAEIRHTVRLEAGKRYLVAAACGFDCWGIDLWAEDAAGNVIDREENLLNDPMLIFEPARTGPITIVIGMGDCDVESDGCGYGLGVFPIPPAPPPQPAAPQPRTHAEPT